ncbi:hypothetical protein D3C86_1831290 [compost metagenome]
MELGIAAFQQWSVLTVDRADLAGINIQRLWQKRAEEFGVAFDFFAKAGIKHLHHIHDTSGLVVKILYRQCL